MKKILLAIIFFVGLLQTSAQVGSGIYRFLDLPVSARIASLGGVNVSLKDNDLNFAFNNPALLSDKTKGVVGLNFANYLADIKYGSAVYSHAILEKNLLSYGVQYIDYGSFEGYDKYGIYTENFTAKDMALYLTYARPLTENITLGATLKPVVSVLERYTSVGLLSDVGLSYTSDLLSAGLVLKNMGVQLKGYYLDEDDKQHREPVPFNIQFGVSKKFRHAPLRVSATLNNLQRWNLLGYQSDVQKTTTSFDGMQTTKKDVGFLDMAFRHLILGVEFLPTESFYLSLGYDHRRHQEMKMEGFKSIAGFSFGGGIKLYKFHVGFGMTQYQVKNYAYQFSISTNLNEFVSF